MRTPADYRLLAEEGVRQAKNLNQGRRRFRLRAREIFAYNAVIVGAVISSFSLLIIGVLIASY